MKVKTRDLIGAQLDWAVAKCEGWECEFSDEVSGPWLIPADGYLNDERPLSGFTPSTNWAQGGPIIEREKMYINFGVLGSPWEAVVPSRTFTLVSYGETALVAAMRAFVLSRLGPEVEIPEEFLK